MAWSFPVSKANYEWSVNDQHTGARLAVHLKDVLDHLELTDGRLLGITTDNAFSNYSMTRELQSTLEASAIQWPALCNHIPCMAHVVQLALGAFMGSFSLKGPTKSWEAHERNQYFGENDSIDIGKCQRLRKEGNTRINKVSAMKPGLANIIEKVHISSYFESHEIDLHIAENDCSINYAETWSSKRVHWLSKSQTSHHSTTNAGYEGTVELNTWVARARLPITGIHTHVAPTSKIDSIPATFHNSRWVDHCEVHHGNIETISIMHPVDVKEAYSHLASRYHSVQWHIRSHGGRDASCG